MTHKEVLENIINSFQLKIIGEIGVYKGSLTEHLLSRCSCIKEYWGIDPWRQYRRADGREAIENTKVKWEAAFLRACSLMKKYEQLRIIRTDSLTASGIFGKQHFDLVFLDGDHDYVPVKRDIAAWSSLVKESGLLCGHDYYQQEPEVVKAVNEVLGYKNIRRAPGAVWIHSSAEDLQDCIPTKQAYDLKIEL